MPETRLERSSLVIVFDSAAVSGVSELAFSSGLTRSVCPHRLLWERRRDRHPAPAQNSDRGATGEHISDGLHQPGHPTPPLFIAHLGQGVIIVVDTNTRGVLARISASGVHGVLAVPQLGKVYAAASDSAQALTIDTDTLQVIARTHTGGTPDGFSYDSANHRVFVSDETGDELTVLEAASGLAIGAVKLGGEVGNNSYDPPSGRILALDQTHNQLDVINPMTLAVIARHHLGNCDHSHSLTLDSPTRRAFVACDGNNQLLTVTSTP